MSTFEREVVLRAILRAKIEEAMSAAAELPEFEGAETIKHLNRARQAMDIPRPLRLVEGFRRRTLWPEDEDGGAA